MNMRNIMTSLLRKTIPALIVAGMAFLCPQMIHSAQKNWDYANDMNTTLREVRDSLDDLKHEVSNHEVEIRTFDEKLNNQGTTLDSLRQQILDATQANKEMVKSNVNSQETKMTNIETLTKGLVADFKLLKTHANDASTSIEQFEQRISRLEKTIEVQNRNIANLQSALTSIASAFDVKESVPSASGSDSSSGSKKYRIKPGDSLEKIARNNGTTIKAIKELNRMSGDKIVVGQSIELP